MFEMENSSDRRQDPGLKHYLRAIARYKLLTPAQECELAVRIRGGDQAALDAMVNANLRFVVAVANRFNGRGLGLMDLIAEGNMGLITAARRFDEERGYRFVTYAVWWIRQSIQGALREQTRTVRLPANRAREAVLLARNERRLEQERSGWVDDEVLFEAVGLDPDKARSIRAACRPNVALDTPVGFDGLTLAESMADATAKLPHEQLALSGLHLDLRQALQDLEAREREVIECYYGLGLEAAMSLEAIGQRLGLSRERVRQIRNQAFARIRRGTRGEVLAAHLR